MDGAVRECTKRHVTKCDVDFYAHPNGLRGRMSKCKECAKAHARANRAANIERCLAYDRQRANDPKRVEMRRQYVETMSEEKSRQIRDRRNRNYKLRHPEKRAAHGLVEAALKSGRLLRQPCEVCGAAERVQAHHDDYSQPLAVRWLCVTHHNEHHKAERRQRWASQEQKA